MNRDEIVDLLAFCAGYDHRRLDDDRAEEEAEKWFLSLRGLDLEDAQSAVVDYYTTQSERIRPSHIYNRVRPPASRHPSSAPVPPRVDVAEGVTMVGAERGRQMAREAHAANQARRERVLRYPDLAEQLCEQPLGYKFPEQWNGFVAPADCQDESPESLRSPSGFPNPGHALTGARRHNDSPRRAALVDICAEAMRREREGTSGEVA